MTHNFGCITYIRGIVMCGGHQRDVGLGRWAARS